MNSSVPTTTSYVKDRLFNSTHHRAFHLSLPFPQAKNTLPDLVLCSFPFFYKGFSPNGVFGTQPTGLGLTLNTSPIVYVQTSFTGPLTFP
jgi:hypothetical protein